jgi:hypothetical protein
MKTREMKLTAVLILLAGAASLIAQDTNKITVPLSSPSQPATIRLHMISGSVTVTGGAGQQVVVESDGAGLRTRGRGRNEPVPPGMHRIGMGDSMGVAEDHNVVTIRPGISVRREHIAIEAPVNTSVEIKAATCGNIDISGIGGEVEVECTNGSINLTNVSGSVVAHTINGSITAALDRVSPDKAMSFTSFNGKVDVTLPADTKARLRLKTGNGEVFTDFDVKLDADAVKPAIENTTGNKGKYKISMDRGVNGSINGGGPEYLFQTMNGDILIHKK